MVHVDEPNEKPSHRPRRNRRARAKALQLANNPTTRAIFIVIGTIGLAALAVAMVGPKRVKRETIDPIGDYLEPHYQKAWDNISPIREQMIALFEKVGPEGRKQLARNLQSWMGHFRAS
jgi:hypothetical protein